MKRFVKQILILKSKLKRLRKAYKKLKESVALKDSEINQWPDTHNKLMDEKDVRHALKLKELTDKLLKEVQKAGQQGRSISLHYAAELVLNHARQQFGQRKDETAFVLRTVSDLLKEDAKKPVAPQPQS